jgi:hypothetical protein
MQSVGRNAVEYLVETPKLDLVAMECISQASVPFE